jgi:ABC-type lipoprotein export system ATPase subunit/GNAT superfamily N-acetyltransferase
MTPITWQKLEKSKVPLESIIEMDEITSNLISPFDYKSEGTEQFFPYLMPKDLPKSFGIGVIVGASGTGKSTLLKTFGEPEKFIWEKNKSIASHFETPQKANEKFAAAGLMSVPDWIKPFQVLSNGQKFRAELARSLKNNAVIDEYTSVIDRNVAKAASTSMSRYVRKNKLNGIVIATVHRDILEFLEPDWVIDTDRGEWTQGRYLQRPELVLKIYPCSNLLWEYFSKHHYLSESLNKASHNFMAVWENRLVGFVSVMSYPSGTVKNAFREHRLVVHPDFQGFGFGPRISETVAKHYTENGKRFFCKTSHPRLGEYRDNSEKWKPTSKNHKIRTDGKTTKGRWVLNNERWSYSHEFIGTNG